MDPIKNIDTLQQVLESESSAWQEIVYEKTKALVNFYPGGADLVSNCGYIDLHADAVYSYALGEDVTSYCEINSIDDLIQYILNMESYQEYLVDKSLGSFMKSELFWAVCSGLVNTRDPEDHTGGTRKTSWGLEKISSYNGDNYIYIELVINLYSCDQVYPCSSVHKGQGIDHCLKEFAEDLNLIACDAHDEFLFRARDHYSIKVPNTLEELKTEVAPGGRFN